MSLERENSGHSSSENTVAHPAQMVPNLSPSIAGKHISTSALKQLFETFKSPASAEQQQQVLATLKANPQLMVAFIKQRQQQHQIFQQRRQLQLQQQWQMLPNEGTMSENDTMIPHQVLPNPDPSIADMQMSSPAWKRVLENSVYSSSENAVAHPAQMVPNPSIASMHSSTSAWKQLLETLNSPASAEQQQHGLAILKANPQFLGVFIKQRRAQQQQKLQYQRQQEVLLRQQHQRQMLLNEDNMTENHTMRPQQQELQHLLQRQQRLLHHRQQRRQMLLEQNMTRNRIMRPHQMLPNSDPSLVDMQIPTEEWQQILETLKTLNLE